MITAAEKFDKIPPWCVVKKGAVRWAVVAHDDRHLTRNFSEPPTWYTTVLDQGNIETESEARRIARLTRPLPSWEPAPDCPLPVDGWNIRKCADGNYGVFTIPDGVFALKALTFSTRRAAYVWAWTEAEHTDGTGATDAPDSRGVLGWTAYDQLCKTVDDTECDIVAIQDRVSKVEGVLARICPEADSQTDGKGRTLVQIDAALEVSYRWHNAAHSAIQATQDKVDDHAARLDKLERLIAAQVPVPAKVNVRSDAASTVEAMTEAAASDEGWREMLVAGGSASRIVYTPCADWCCNERLEWAQSCLPGIPVAAGPNGPNETQRTIIRTCPPPPNLAEWYKPGAKTTTESGDDAAHRFAKALVAASEAVPPTYRVGDDLAAWVRNLASAHDTALTVARTLRTQLADAQTAAVAAEGRARSVLNVVCASCREAVKAALGKGELPGCKL